MHSCQMDTLSVCVQSGNRPGHSLRAALYLRLKHPQWQEGGRQGATKKFIAV